MEPPIVPRTPGKAPPAGLLGRMPRTTGALLAFLCLVQLGPAVARPILERRAGAALGLPVSIGHLAWKPVRGALRLDDVRIGVAPARLRIRTLLLDVAMREVSRHRLILDELLFDGVELTIDRDLVERFSPEAAQEPSPAQVVETVEAAIEAHGEPFVVATHLLAVRKAAVRVSGDLVPERIRDFDATIDRLELREAGVAIDGTYVSTRVRLDGVLAGSSIYGTGRVDVYYEKQDLVADLDLGGLTLNGERLVLPPSISALNARVGGHVHLERRRMPGETPWQVATGSVDADQLAVTLPPDTQVVVDTLRVRGAASDLDAGTVQLGETTLVKPNVTIATTADAPSTHLFAESLQLGDLELALAKGEAPDTGPPDAGGDVPLVQGPVRIGRVVLDTAVVRLLAERDVGITLPRLEARETTVDAASRNVRSIGIDLETPAVMVGRRDETVATAEVRAGVLQLGGVDASLAGGPVQIGQLDADEPVVRLPGEPEISVAARHLAVETAAMEPGGRALRLRGARLEAPAVVSVHGRRRESSTPVRADTLELGGIDLPLAGGAVQVARLDARGVALRLPGAGEIAVGAPRLQLSGTAVDVDARMVRLAGLELERPDLRVTLAEPGVSTAAATRAPEPGPAPAPWRVATGPLRLHDGTATLIDRPGDAGRRLDFRVASAEWGGLETGVSRSFRLHARPGPGGSVVASGRLGLEPLDVAASLTLLELPLPAIAELLGGGTPGAIRFSKGRLGGQLDARIEGDRTTVRGRVRLDDAHLAPPDPAHPEETMAVHELVADLDARFDEARRVDVSSLKLSYPYAMLRRRPGGFYPFDLLAPAAAASEAGPVPASDVGPAAAEPATAGAVPVPPTRWRVAHAEISGGRVDFLDAMVRPESWMGLYRLDATARDLDAPPLTLERFELGAQVNGTATLRADGAIGPTGSSADFQLEGLSLAGFNPYVTPVTQYVVDSGSLTSKHHLRLAGRRIDTRNELELQDLSLRSTGSDGLIEDLGLPASVALGLLEDPAGVISLDVPVKGDLARPEIDFGDLVSQALRKALVGLLTTPLKLLGATFASGGDRDPRKAPVRGDPIDFAPGSAELAGDGRERAEQLGRLLRAGPQLGLVLRPTSSAADVQAVGGGGAADAPGREDGGVADAPGREDGGVPAAPGRERGAVAPFPVERLRVLAAARVASVLAVIVPGASPGAVSVATPGRASGPDTDPGSGRATGPEAAAARDGASAAPVVDRIRIDDRTPTSAAGLSSAGGVRIEIRP